MSARPPRRARLGRPSTRLRATMLVIGFVMTLFIGRLLQVQGLDATAYAAQAERQRTHTVTLQAQRGDITDRDGAVLATTVDARSVYADPTQVRKSKTTNAADMAAKLAPILGVDAASLQANLERTNTRFVYLAKGLSPQQGAQVMALKLPGIGLEPESKRVYPNGDLAANVLGFVGADHTGLSGLEFSLETMLHGTDGTRSVEVSSDGRVIPDGASSGHDAIAGDTVRLTIDRDIQWQAQQAIAAQVAATQSQYGAVIVMRPQTGEILALAVAPTFDPNDPGASPAADRGNRALSDVFEPGSTSKVITMAAGLDTGIVTPTTPITVPTTLTRLGHTFHDAEWHPEEHLTLAGVLAHSSNIGTILASDRIGTDNLYKYLRAFGFGSKSGLGFPGESAGILPPPDKWMGVQKYTIPFGQGLAVNALQVADVFATIANGGVRVTPSLVSGYQMPDGTFQSAPAAATSRVIKESTATQLSQMLEAVTSDEGTAPKASIPGYRVAGKTGTAQRVDPACGCYRGYTASFAGFAPADDPQLVVLAVLQDPQGPNHSGGSIAAPVFKDVMTFGLQSLKIPPTGTPPPHVQLEAAPDPAVKP